MKWNVSHHFLWLLSILLLFGFASDVGVFRVLMSAEKFYGNIRSWLCVRLSFRERLGGRTFLRTIPQKTIVHEEILPPNSRSLGFRTRFLRSHSSRRWNLNPSPRMSKPNCYMWFIPATLEDLARLTNFSSAERPNLCVRIGDKSSRKLNKRRVDRKGRSLLPFCTHSTNARKKKTKEKRR